MNWSERKAAIKGRVDIVELIGAQVPLQPVSQHMSGACPLCGAERPSFRVFPQTQHFKCFSCGRGGDVFTFLMEKDGLNFQEAVERLDAVQP